MRNLSNGCYANDLHVWTRKCLDPYWKITKLKGFLAILVLNAWKITISKLPSQHSMLGHHRPASETPFKWGFAVGPMIVHFYWVLGLLTPKQLKKLKNVSVEPPLTKLSGSVHDSNLSSRAVHYETVMYCLLWQFVFWWTVNLLNFIIFCCPTSSKLCKMYSLILR